jgi:hypothetical protein
MVLTGLLGHENPLNAHRKELAATEGAREKEGTCQMRILVEQTFKDDSKFV